MDSNRLSSTYAEILQRPSEFRNSSEVRLSQSLSSLSNDPESSIIQSFWSKLSFWSSSRESVSEETVDFSKYLSKVEPLMSEFVLLNTPESNPIIMADHSILEDFLSEDLSTEACLETYKEIDQISDLLDKTDLAIFYKISTKWHHFLDVSKDLEFSQDGLSSIMAMVSDLSRKGKEIENQLIIKLGYIVSLQHRLNNMKKLQEVVRLIRLVRETEPTVNNLLTAEHYTKATHLINKTQQTLASKLQGVKAVANERAQLEEKKILMVKMVDAELNSFMARTIKTALGKDNLVKIIEGSFQVEVDRKRIEDLVDNKLYAGTLNSGLANLQEHLWNKVKEETKEVVNYLGVQKIEGSRWKNISHSHTVMVLKTFRLVCQTVFNILQEFGSVVLHKLGGEKGEYWQVKASINAKPLINQLEKMEHSLFKIFTCKFAKIMKSRKHLFLKLNVSEIQEIYQENKELAYFNYEYFHVKSELNNINELLDMEHNYFLAFHEKKIQKIQLCLQRETWSKINMPEETPQKILEKRTEASRIGGVKLKSPEFTATSSLLKFYSHVYKYVDLCQTMNLSGEGTMILVEYIKDYNKSLKFLIIEAGAMSFGLKSITSKHLGLAAQIINFMLEEMPYIKVHIETAVNDPSKPIQELNTVITECEENLGKIHKKLVSIIIDRSQKKCESAINEINWDVMATIATTDKEYYSVQIATDISNMLSILMTVLPVTQMHRIFIDIATETGKVLQEFFGRININSSVSAQRVRNDIQLLIGILREKVAANLLEYVNDLEDELNTVVTIRCQPYLEFS